MAERLRKLQLPKIYPITDRQLSRKSHPEIVAALIQGGATWIQLREKRLCARDLYGEARKAARICRQKRRILLINDRVDIALATDSDGVHLGQQDFPVSVARQVLGKDKIIGVSTHTLGQAIRANASDADYIAAGPVFATSTKVSEYEPLGLSVLSRIRERVDKPLVAIGGINFGNFLDVLRVGADSVAIISDLMTARHIAKKMREFLDTAQKA